MRVPVVSSHHQRGSDTLSPQAENDDLEHIALFFQECSIFHPMSRNGEQRLDRPRILMFRPRLQPVHFRHLGFLSIQRRNRVLYTFEVLHDLSQ